jgi:hypothetical protein
VPAQANVREFCAVERASVWVSTELARIARNSSFCCSRVSRKWAMSSGVVALGVSIAGGVYPSREGRLRGGSPPVVGWPSVLVPPRFRQTIAAVRGCVPAAASSSGSTDRGRAARPDCAENTHLADCRRGAASRRLPAHPSSVRRSVRPSPLDLGTGAGVATDRITRG